LIELDLPHPPKPIDLARVVGAIRANAPELSDDLDVAITAWLEQERASAGSQIGPSELNTRRSRLQALRELLSLSPYEPDSRD